MKRYETSARIIGYSFLAGFILLIILILTSCSSSVPTTKIDYCKPNKKGHPGMVKPEATAEKYPNPKRK